MALITIDVPEETLAAMKQYDISPQEALDYGLELLIKEEPDEESLRKFEESAQDDREYTAETVEDAFKRLGLDKW